MISSYAQAFMHIRTGQMRRVAVPEEKAPSLVSRRRGRSASIKTCAKGYSGFRVAACVSVRDVLSLPDS
jgi:hypothetical protein